ncbi:hypothetical protein Tco_1027815 [Tanacetum coccineum]
MEDEVAQCSVEKKYFELKKKQLLINNDRLLEENISCDIICAYLCSLHRVDNCASCSYLEIELLNQKESNKLFNELSKSFAKLEKHCISLELSLQNTKEEMICNEPWKVNEASLITKINKKYFEITNLKSQLQEKSIFVNELKPLLATLKEKSQMTLCEPSDVDSRFHKIKDENVSIAFQVSSLVKEREHIKLNAQISKNAKLRVQLQAKFSEPQLNQSGTSVNTIFSKPSTSRTKLYSMTPFPKPQFIPKVVEKNDLSKTITSHLNNNKVIEKCIKILTPGLLKIKSEPINAYFKNNRVVHRDYVRVTKKHVETLQELLEQAKALKPSNVNLDYTHKFAQRIQELLVYVSASCPFTKNETEKWSPATS